MKSRFRERFWWTAAVLLMTAVLVTFGILQYRWSGAVSDAASVRLQASLQSSVWGFRQELHRDMAALCPPMRSSSPTDFASQLSDWGEANAEHADLVAQLYWWRGVGGAHPQLQRFDPTTHQFSGAEWPASLGPLSQWMEHASAHMEMMMGPHGGPEPPHEQHHRPHMVRVGAPPCVLDENTPALVRPLPSNEMTSRSGPAAHDWLVVVLDQHAITAKLLPELSARYFSGANGLDFDVAVLGGPEGHDVIYTSEASFKPHASPPDAEAPLFGFIALAPGRPGAVLSPGPPPRLGSSPGSPDAARAGMLNRVPDAPDWLLVVRHRNGSLEQMVERARHRDLALSFGILLLLAATMALIVVTTHRAQRLARLQMEFVTGVSHELRTPLTVIASAAQNLSDGIVSAGPQVARYGGAIREQAEQLKGLVEQILLFAATRDGQYRYNLRPVAPQQIVDAALAHTSELVRTAGVKVETSVAPNLPSVMADLSAISQCLQNLITNAVKYGGDQHWVGIETRAAANGRANEVQISVADKGIGLRGRELERVFEPFYRGDEAISAQIHGTGLGLTLARSIAEGMGGSITVTSTPGAGSIFTLHLPAATATVDARVPETVAK
jgi:signal transduction histidine kinase